MNNNFGIYEKSYSLIIRSFREYPKIEKVYIFGSRAMGNYKPGSDIDIAIFGEEIDFEITSSLFRKLNEDILTPYFIDVVNFNTIEVEELKTHILNEGIVVYERK